LLPFLPYAALLLSRLLTEPYPGTPTLSTLALGVLFLIAFGIPVLVRAGTFALRGAAFAEIRAGSRQVEQVIAAHPGETVAAGYGGDGFLDLQLSYLRVLPVSAGHPLLYNATAMDDLCQGGADRAIIAAGPRPLRRPGVAGRQALRHPRSLQRRHLPGRIPRPLFRRPLPDTVEGERGRPVPGLGLRAGQRWRSVSEQFRLGICER
jgi:hypothetical protein